MSPSAGKLKGTSNSDWMSQLPPTLHNIPLYELAIPGSHDSMSYDLDVNSMIVEPAGLTRLSKICCARKILRRWAVTQEVTITKQLDAGVRYFDLRIARKPNDNDPTRLYFYHGLYTRTDVESVLKVINEWAVRHPKELLILSLSHFKGVDDKLHHHLINFIKTLFGAKLFLRNDKPTLQTCWDKGRNVLVSYDHKKNPHHGLWNKIPYYYANSMDTTKVQADLQKVLEKTRPAHSFFVCGLNLTLPHNGRILIYVLRLCDNFGNVVLRSLPRLLQWLRQQAAKTKPNIVASDMVTRDDFVSTVIKFNTPKA